MSERQLSFTLNGDRREASADPRMHLADFLRHGLGLTGTHLGCEHGVCGACTVIVDGAPVRSCLMLAVQIDGCTVETVEGLARGGELSPLQQAFSNHHGLQCGFCTPGMLMSLEAFLRVTASPTEHDIRVAISGNICRCTGYQGIVEAALTAAAAKGSRT
ncbi:(2Fe-2S)-binding protein [Bradyrhizobium sp. 182]|uniref:(2Fe-2S)-binding protein n=1 Tax=unclassified Bradyrhizobium TaxID=2631580 RepID=UPI001FFAF18D|nr:MULTISPECIES: (2Fe-2S)-binding protein [unclassified Bradyrhizobium]MCK1423009.1 (2Fe-2S)-binding protein [Bradyrhizobium sp. CW12]MCK1529376.1 (2Fe-2S)-binding protein [Bradyrhizobium sp. 182]MCK1643776.1 (2Fe-2S)-binding protein [Bradyrhizobium sp. 154]